MINRNESKLIAKDRRNAARRRNPDRRNADHGSAERAARGPRKPGKDPAR